MSRPRRNSSKGDKEAKSMPIAIPNNTPKKGNPSPGKSLNPDLRPRRAPTGVLPLLAKVECNMQVEGRAPVPTEVPVYGLIKSTTKKKIKAELHVTGQYLYDTQVTDFVKWLASWCQEVYEKYKGKTIKLSLDLRHNCISNKGVEQLVSVLGKLEQSNLINIKRLWLFKNAIGDDGAISIAKFIRANKYPIQELHLSHNRITAKGAAAIFEAFAQNPVYSTAVNMPKPSEKQKKKKNKGNDFEFDDDEVTPSNVFDGVKPPVWLRLEWNDINPPESALKVFSESGGRLTYCMARELKKNGKSCTPNTCPAFLHNAKSDPKTCKFWLQAKCNKGNECKQLHPQPPIVHLYAFHMQNEPYKECEQLQKATSLVQQAKNNLKAKLTITPSSTPAVNTTTGTNTTNSTPIIINNSSSSVLSLIPTYIFVDSCAVLQMCRANSRGFTFDALFDQVRKGLFGPAAYPAPGDQVYLVFTNTVRDELDKLKDKSRRDGDRDVEMLVKLLLGEPNGIVCKCKGLGILLSLNAYEEEDGSVNSTNDMRIIKVAAYWNEQIGETGNVVILTRDLTFMQRAAEHRIPCVYFDDFTSNILKLNRRDPAAGWTASNLKVCIGSALTAVSGQTPLKGQRSLAAEVDAAVSITTKFMSEYKLAKDALQQLHAMYLAGKIDPAAANQIFSGFQARSSEVDGMMNDADDCLMRWNLVLSQHTRPMTKPTPSTPISPSSSITPSSNGPPSMPEPTTPMKSTVEPPSSPPPEESPGDDELCVVEDELDQGDDALSFSYQDNPIEPSPPQSDEPSSPSKTIPAPSPLQPTSLQSNPTAPQPTPSAQAPPPSSAPPSSAPPSSAPPSAAPPGPSAAGKYEPVAVSAASLWNVLSSLSIASPPPNSN